MLACVFGVFWNSAEPAMLTSAAALPVSPLATIHSLYLASMKPTMPVSVNASVRRAIASSSRPLILALPALVTLPAKPVTFPVAS